MSANLTDAQPGADPVAPAPAPAETPATVGSVDAGEDAKPVEPAGGIETGNSDENAKPVAPQTEAPQAEAPHTKTVPDASSENTAAVASDEPAQPAVAPVAQASGELANESGPHGEQGESSSAPSGPVPDNASEVSLHAMSGYSLGLSIDTDNSDADSSLGLDDTSSSRSANSSIYDFVNEFGRTFHRYKEGKYYMPNDEQERSRLDLQHAIALRLLGNKLGTAPVEHERSIRVLDIGTGTGIWAVEFAEQYPAADVIGTDLSPIQPEYVPPNCQFEIDDAEDEWVWRHKFDYVHGRYIVPFLNNLPKLMDNIYDNLNPGGYVEFLEAAMLFQAVDNTLDGKPMKVWNQLMIEGIRKVGREPLAALHLRGFMADAGFVNITEKRFAVPINPWARGRENKIIGAMEQENLLEVADGITKAIFTKALGWSVEEVEVLLADVRKNLKDQSIHAYLPFICIYGQKPFPV